MRLVGAVLVAAALLVIFALLPYRAAEAKCGEWAMLFVDPSGSHGGTRNLEVGWLDTVTLSGFCWAEWDADGALVWTPDEIEIWVRFVAARADVGDEPPRGDPDLVVKYAEREGFEARFDLDDMPDPPAPRQPDWIELTARAGEMEVQTSVMVSAGQRPADSAFISGRVRNMPPPPMASTSSGRK